MLLRWGPEAHVDPMRPRLKITQISRLLKISREKVRRILKQCEAGGPNKDMRTVGAPSKLEPRHVAFLTDIATLQAWGARSLAERVVLFHRHFGEIKITPSTLRRVYRRHNITRKALRYLKTLKYQPPEMRALEIIRMKQEVRDAIAHGKRIIYTDEAMFTTATMLDRSYAGRHQNVTIEDKLASSPALAVLAGVS